MKEDDELIQNYFISNDGYINLRLKVTTDDEIEKEKIIATLYDKLKNAEGFELSKTVVVDQIYFKDQDPVTFLEKTKNKILEDIKFLFDSTMNQGNL